MGFKIRREAPGDEDAVRELLVRAFAPSPAEAQLVDALRGSDDAVPQLWLVALRDGKVVGHIAFSEARLDSGHDVLVLAPMAVLPELQGRGAGTALVREGLRRAGRTGYPLVSVLGHPDYYPRFGFEPADPLGIQAPFEVPSEAWMALPLPSYTAEARGVVQYADAFADVT